MSVGATPVTLNVIPPVGLEGFAAWPGWLTDIWCNPGVVITLAGIVAVNSVAVVVKTATPDAAPSTRICGVPDWLAEVISIERHGECSRLPEALLEGVIEVSSKSPAGFTPGVSMTHTPRP